MPHYLYQSTYIMYLGISAENNIAAWKRLTHIRGSFLTFLVSLSHVSWAMGGLQLINGFIAFASGALVC